MTRIFLAIGAGPGIGLATARRFAREGYEIVLAARDPQRLQQHAAALEAAGARVRTQTVDAADPQAVAALVRDIGPDLHVLHYNAGVLHYDAAGRLCTRSIDDESVASMASDLAIDIGSALAAMQAALPAMSARGAGSLLLTGGGLGVQPSGDFLTLSVGKAGLRAAAQALFEPLRARGIHVATVTVSRLIDPGSPQADEVAEAFWALHAEAPSAWTLETIYR